MSLKQQKTKAGLREPVFGASRRRIRDRAVAIVGLIAVGKPDDLLRVAIEFVLRNDVAIGDDVVDEAGTDRAGKAEIVDLDRSGAHGEDAGPRVLGVSFQVDQDVDLERPDQVGDLVVAVAV